MEEEAAVVEVVVAARSLTASITTELPPGVRMS